MIRPIIIAIIGAGIAAMPHGTLRVTRRTAPTASDCGASTPIPPQSVESVMAAAVRSIVLEGAADEGGEKKWCAQSKPLFVISQQRANIRGCGRIVFVGGQDEALRRADTAGGGTEYIKLDLDRNGADQRVEIVVERGRIVRASDAVQVKVRGKRRADDDRPTLFRGELSRYRISAEKDRVDICRYSSVVI